MSGMTVRYCSTCKTLKPLGHEEAEHEPTLWDKVTDEHAELMGEPVEHFDRTEAATARDQGMARAEAAAGDAWKDRWRGAIGDLAERGEPFTADDVRALVGEPDDHRNAAGALFRGMAAQGVIRHVGYRKSARTVLHSHPIAVWVGNGHQASAG